MVVIAIIGVLASVVIAALGPSRARARDAVRISDIHEIQTALNLYYEDNGKYPEPDIPCCNPTLHESQSNFSPPTVLAWEYLADVLAPKYIPSLPVDPLNGYINGNLYVYTYHVNPQHTTYDLTAFFEEDNPLACKYHHYVSNVDGTQFCQIPGTGDFTYLDHQD
jgi:type II secretory pathway pseudopilin PulG